TEPAPPPPAPPPGSPTPTPRPYLTVGTTDRFTQPDPAGVTTQASSGLAYTVFQRLMTVPAVGPDEVPVLKPEAARECVVSSPTTYECTLNEGMTFHNGHELTSSDVKFSIERALRLDVDGTAVPLLSTLRRIETPDELTVRFVLNRPDNQFGFALATPAASIVDEEVYDPDELRPVDQTVAGSGPYRVSELGTDEVRFDRFARYVGPAGGREQTLLVRTFADSGSLEQAMTDRQVDAVWRGLGSAARTRLTSQVESSTGGRSESGFAPTEIPGARVHRLWWSPTSPAREDAAVRVAVRDSLQGERILDSIVPPTVWGYAPAFEVGGEPTTEPRPRRTRLVLSYDSTVPDGEDQANVVRSRLEDGGDLSVQITPDLAEADLFLLDEKAWTSTPTAWLQRYLEHPAPGSTTRVGELMDRYRASTVPEEAEGLLSELQQQAAADAVLVPIAQAPEQIWLAQGVTWVPSSFGPGHQLTLSGLGRG
ncbi:ABC transporter substrate-binding protein, partial [Desertihabitans aurantiacus]|uniref:ABC transporter substrate-binding protein n=1 Tax=Desertihabitans aurantiacus TaxID=2282477 RepID=UPI001E43C44E